LLFSSSSLLFSSTNRFNDIFKNLTIIFGKKKKFLCRKLLSAENYCSKNIKCLPKILGVPKLVVYFFRKISLPKIEIAAENGSGIQYVKRYI
jgi:hypothetical protein